MIDQDNVHMKFSALYVIDFSNPSPDSLRSRRPAQAGVKDGYLPLYKVVIFTAIISCSVKTVADRYRLLRNDGLYNASHAYRRDGSDGVEN